MLEQVIGAMLGVLLGNVLYLTYQVISLKKDVKNNQKNIGVATKTMKRCAKKLNIVINNNGGE